MSRRPINLSPDLSQLQAEGYDLEIRGGLLLIKDVPYLNSSKEIRRGILVSNLKLASDVTERPDPHTVHFTGDYPCDVTGTAIKKFSADSSQQTLAKDLVVQHRFSTRPACGYYNDYYEKMMTYIAIISGPAEVIDPSVSARTYPVIEADEEESVFRYIDNASSAAGIDIVSDKLKIGKVAIVGLGGTGSYVLDLVAKTPVKEIHLFDGDRFSQHNAFRSPGAAALHELSAKKQKVEYFAERYSEMRRGIVTHDCYVDSTNLELLREMDFVFLCMDRGEHKKVIVESLNGFNVPFVDVGMGIYRVDDSLAGILRLTTSSAKKKDHVVKSISFAGNDEANEYAHNIQVADLNALNASLAVIKWKKLFGFYKDLDEEHVSMYTIDGNCIANEEKTL